MVDYNPIGVRQPLNIRILDSTVWDNEPYIGKPGSIADQFKTELSSGKVPGIVVKSSSQAGNNLLAESRSVL